MHVFWCSNCNSITPNDKQDLHQNKAAHENTLSMTKISRGVRNRRIKFELAYKPSQRIISQSRRNGLCRQE